MTEKPEDRPPGSDSASTAELPAGSGPAPTTELPAGSGPASTAELPAEPPTPGAPGPAGQEFPLAAGEVIEGSNGRYRLLEPHGRGGQSWVYLAEALSGRHPPGTRLALKLYRETVAPDQRVMEVIAALEHPGLLRVIDYGWRQGRFYEVMPWAEGGSLLDLVETGGPLGAEELRSVVRLVNDVLEYCHAHEVIHGDIKPANLFFLDSARTRLVVGDFGVAARLRPGESLVPLERFTPGFLGPEAYGGDVGRESDYHALGVTLIWLATGRSPWEGREGTEEGRRRIRQQILSGTLPVPDALPERFRTLIEGLLVKERGRRWGNSEVRRWLAGQNVPVAERGMAHPRVAAPAPAGARSFLFEGRIYTDPVELAEAFAHNWEEAKKRLYRGHVRRWAETFDLDLANRCQDLEESETDQDRGVFRMIYHLHPGAPFAYRGEVQSSPEAVGAALGRALEAQDQAAVERIAEAAAKGLLAEWLRGRGREELAAAVDELAAGLDGDRQFALFRLHYVLCPERPYRSAGSELATPLDLALFLAGDWAGRAHLAWDTGLLAWLTERGRGREVADWRAASGNYEGDHERGMAVFLALVCPETASEPRVIEAYRARVEARLERVRELLETYDYQGNKAQELEGEGRELAASDEVDASDYRTIVELHGRAQRWLERWARLRRDSPEWGEGIFPSGEADRMVAAATATLDQAMDRLEALVRFLREQGGGFPWRTLAELRQAAARAETVKEKLTVLGRIEAEVEAEADRRAGQLEALAARPDYTGDNPVGSLIAFPSAFIIAWNLGLRFGFLIGVLSFLPMNFAIRLLINLLSSVSANRSRERARERSELSLAACCQALHDIERLAAEIRLSREAFDDLRRLRQL